MELKDICQYISEKVATTTLTKENYISTENMLPDKGGIVTASGVPFGNSTAFSVGDVLVSNIRPYFKKIWQANRNGGCSADVLCFRANSNVDNSYFYYLLSQQEFFDYIMSGAKGCKMPRGDKRQIMQWKVELPPLDEQRHIASVLLSLDEKIELNRRINGNLEQQAQTLFKAWFVENPNPQWLDGRLSDIASFVGGYSYKGNELVDFSNIGMATIKNYERSGGFKTDGFKDINPSPKVKSTQYAELFDILVAHTDLTQNADVIGNAELLLSFDHYKHIIFSMDLVKVLPNKNFPYRFLLAAMLKNRIFKSHCLSYVNGTTVLHLSKKALPEYEITIPTDKEAKRMNDILGCYYKQMAEILRENDILENLRNTILPKLMSGKLKINDLNR